MSTRLEKVTREKFLKQREEGIRRDSCSWLKHGQLKKETEGLTLARQDQALSVNARITPLINNMHEKLLDFDLLRAAHCFCKQCKKELIKGKNS